MDKFIGQHHDDKMPVSNNGQRRIPRNTPQTSGTAGSVNSAIDVVTGEKIHRGREGATIPGKE